LIIVIDENVKFITGGNGASIQFRARRLCKA